jgi:dTDP-4-amino-4,6-dideoxygalactose transaminase
MIALYSEDEYNILKTLRDSGRIRTARKFNYTVFYPGWNFYQSDIHAALGLSQLRRYDSLMTARDECFGTYQKYLKQDSRDKRTKYLYQIWVEDAIGLADYLKENGVQVSKHFTPIHTQPAYQPSPKLPFTELMCEHLLSIPYYPYMEEEDIKKVSELINNWRKSNG